MSTIVVTILEKYSLNMIQNIGKRIFRKFNKNFMEMVINLRVAVNNLKSETVTNNETHVAYKMRYKNSNVHIRAKQRNIFTNTAQLISTKL